jgi:copper chaperone NosL
MTRRRLLHALAAMALVVACADNQKPIEPVWGKQACAHCSMILSDRRFGAQTVTSAGDRLFFDDPGCMAVFFEERGVAPVHAWVREAGSDRWLDARAATYVAGAPSPMGFGYEARAGDGVGWDAMRARVIEKAKQLP